MDTIIYPRIDPQDPRLRRVVRQGLCFACYDEVAFDCLYHEVFEEEVYRFTPDSPRPYIIDAGANLGLATCYFKLNYPEAAVLAFEPDLRFGALFSHNIEANRLNNVSLRPAALARCEGTAPLYGDLNHPTPHALGNSLRLAWGMQQPDSAMIEVPTELLSAHLNRRVDLLKIDVEGSEGDILKEAAQHLHCVREIRMEVHQTRFEPNLLTDIKRLLIGVGFDLSVQPRPMREHLPAAAIPWFEKQGAEIFFLSAKKSKY